MTPPRSMPPLIRTVASRPDKRFILNAHKLLFGRPFSGRSANRLLVLFEPNRISYASVFPFLFYAKAFAQDYDAEIRLLPVERALEDGLPKGISNPTHVLAQTWLTDPPEKHAALARLFGQLPRETFTAYLDSFANADIRLAAVFTEVDLYFKKSLFSEPGDFLRPTYGHTNLTEYYGKLYDLPDETTDWGIPGSVLPKLRLAPNFLTSPDLLADLLGQDETPSHDDGERDIDLHARLGGTNRGGWYGEMRRQAAAAVDRLQGLHIASGSGVSKQAYMNEMRRSKICFSPFGYGELCWRDIEAMSAGAILLKPDMAHLRTEPDLFVDDETYISCQWDFSDLEEKIHALIADKARRQRIARTAREKAHRYLVECGPVATYGAMFTTSAKNM